MLIRLSPAIIFSFVLSLSTSLWASEPEIVEGDYELYVICIQTITDEMMDEGLSHSDASRMAEEGCRFILEDDWRIDLEEGGTLDETGSFSMTPPVSLNFTTWAMTPGFTNNDYEMYLSCMNMLIEQYLEDGASAREAVIWAERDCGPILEEDAPDDYQAGDTLDLPDSRTQAPVNYINTQGNLSQVSTPTILQALAKVRQAQINVRAEQLVVVAGGAGVLTLSWRALQVTPQGRTLKIVGASALAMIGLGPAYAQDLCSFYETAEGFTSEFLSQEPEQQLRALQDCPQLAGAVLRLADSL
jgi:hypothetical protein